MKNIHKYFLILIFLFLLGCAPAKESVRHFENAEEIEKYFEDNLTDIKTFYGIGNLTIESPEFSNNAHCRVKIKYPDSLLIELSGVFGISIGVILITEKEFTFYNQVENKIIKGDFNKTAYSYLNINLTFKEMIDFFSCRFFYKFINYNSSNLSKEDNIILLQSTLENLTKKMWIDAISFNINKVALYKHNGEKIFEGFAKIYDKKLNIPTWMRIISYNHKSILTLAYTDIKMNKAIDFDIPLIFKEKIVK